MPMSFKTPPSGNVGFSGRGVVLSGSTTRLATGPGLNLGEPHGLGGSTPSASANVGPCSAEQ